MAKGPEVMQLLGQVLYAAWSDVTLRAVMLVIPVNLVFAVGHVTGILGPWDDEIEWAVGLYTFVSVILAIFDLIFRQLGSWIFRLRAALRRLGLFR